MGGGGQRPPSAPSSPEGADDAQGVSWDEVTVTCEVAVTFFYS